MSFVLVNNFNTTLSAASSNTSDTFTVSSSANLPTLAAGEVLPITLNDAATRLVFEICYVTGISGNILTVERAQEGTSAHNWNVGDFIWNGPTAGTALLQNTVDAFTTSGLITANGGITTDWINTTSIFNVKYYGATGNGTTDDTTAIQNALNAAETAGNATVYFPAGAYLVSSQLSWTAPGINSRLVIKGDRQGVSAIVWASTSSTVGIVLNNSGTNDVDSSAFTIKNLSLYAGGAFSSATALTVNQSGTIGNPNNLPQSKIENVTISGDKVYSGSNYFLNGIIFNSFSNVSIVDTTIIGPSTLSAGNGISTSGTSATPPAIFNLSRVMIQYFTHGFNFGDYTQGVTVDQSNFNENLYGIYVPASLSNLNQLTVSNSQFMNTGGAIWTNSQMNGLIIVGNLIFVYNDSTGIVVSGAYGSIIGNTFFLVGSAPLNQNGIEINGVGPIIISGNMIQQQNYGINLTSSSSLITVLGNAYQLNASANVLNNGTSNSVGVATD